MRTAISIATTAIFFLLAIQLSWHVGPHNPFYSFTVSVYYLFPFSFLIYVPLFAGIAFLHTYCVVEGASLDDERSEIISGIDAHTVAICVAIGVVIFMIPAAIVGMILSENFNKGYFSVKPDGFRLYHFFGFLASLIYVPSFVVLMSSLGFYVGATLPAFIAGVIALSDRGNLQAAIERTLERDRPDRAIEQQLAQIMRANMINERQVEELVSQLSPFRQWVARVRYRKRMRDARRLNEMVAAKMQALRAEGDLSQTVHEMDGVRRERDERGGWR